MIDDERDSLDELLRSRAAAAAPPDFVPAVMRRVPRAPANSASAADLIVDYGRQAGLMTATVGVAMLLDIERLTATIDGVLAAPMALQAIAIVALCLTWVLTTKKPEAEAL